ncbi:hypothetical protein POJ06DRAFT_126674 [Lipomyces tetrasporus]|uniref:Uncharacterized protein n=1 Tax=Lipomyces tetrasporus TaxID=54092 RepID=A0AAD7QPP6_9ASCO|nr:uncharacterized protein POJ06DRAFT_126674 [Lipomyces tetrasporus]KAJ8099033.1 hypothetical protein POJ06DRAFT_126674 [Lipomyces tetrasporus]
MIQYSAISQLREHGFPENISSSVQSLYSVKIPFCTRYSGSIKYVDAGAVFGRDRSHTRTCAVIGWTVEQCSDIQDDVRLLLCGAEYQTVIVVRIEESPQYHSPVVDEAVEFIRPDYDQEIDILRAAFSNISEKSPLGPYVYGNFAWVGRIANLFLDVYKRRGKTDEPEVTRHLIIQDGQCVKRGKMNLNLTIGELAPTAEVNNSNTRRIPITIYVDGLLSCLEMAMVQTGDLRFGYYCLRPESSA